MASLRKLTDAVLKNQRALTNPTTTRILNDLMRSRRMLDRATVPMSAFPSRPLTPPRAYCLPSPRGNARIAHLEAKVAILEAEVARNNKAQMDALAEIKDLGRNPNY